jgi:3-deoxy-D-manno-octulosonic-acid transferase
MTFEKRIQALPSRSAEVNAGGMIALGGYRFLWWLLSPFVRYTLRARARGGKEDPARLKERYGEASRIRPPGTLIWIHGASVGESLAALPLASRLLETGGRHVLVTSGTVTSAKLLNERLPERVFHQYAPIDRTDAVRAFLRHWRPDLALFIESELWPNRVVETNAAGVPIALVNARLSDRSFTGWKRAHGAARQLLSCIDVCLAQDVKIAGQLRILGAPSVLVSGSLKADAPPLPFDASALAAFRASVNGRRLFLAAQTHPGEEEAVLGAAATIRSLHPDLLTVIVPRHPDRGEAIALLAEQRGFSVVRRAGGALPDKDTGVYIADTLGELGLFYRAAPFVFLGASLVPKGGHNPLEPAILGVPVLTGPHVENFAETFRTLMAAQGTKPVLGAEDLAHAAGALLAEPEKAVALGAKAREAVAQLAGALDRTVETAERLLADHARP